jgi:putative integral membrane protein (TIGR02587 family)
MAATSSGAGWSDELTALARAATGGFLIGVPLLYTMEVWWVGQRTSPLRTAMVLAVAFVVIVVIHRTAGFRRARDTHLLDATTDAAVSVALGLVLATIVLVLLREIDGATPLSIAANKAAYQAVPFALGAGVARYVLTGSREGGDDDPTEDGSSPPAHTELSASVTDIGASAIGAILVGLAIAPTDEIPMLDAAIEGPWLLALMAASMAISYAIVFVAGFAGQQDRLAQHGWFQHPISETVMCYVVSLLCALVLLWTFRRLGATPGQALSHMIVLGLPTSIGAAAGRLAV